MDKIVYYISLTNIYNLSINNNQKYKDSHHAPPTFFLISSIFIYFKCSRFLIFHLVFKNNKGKSWTALRAQRVSSFPISLIMTHNSHEVANNG